MKRLGLIGLGAIMRGAHVPGIRKCPDLAIAALCDIDPRVLAEQGERLGVPEDRRFADYRDLLACAGVDAVDIATPNDSHAAIALAAIAAGKPLACEKPLALDAPSAEAVAAAAKAAGLPDMVCFSYRYRAAARFARDIVRRGDVGRVHHVAIQYFQGWGLADVNCPLVWRFVKARTGSGALGDLGSHAADLVPFVTGLRCRRVVGQCATVVKERPLPGEPAKTGAVDVDDCANFLAEMDGGATGIFQITRLAFGRGNYQRMEVYGSRGALVYTLDADGSGRDTLDLCLGKAMGAGGSFVRTEIPERYRADQMQSFADVLLGRGDGLSATLADGAANMRVMDAVLESARTGLWIDIEN